MENRDRIVITGVGLTSPIGDTYADMRRALLEGRGGIQDYEIRYFGKTFAGICNYDPLKYQTRKEVRRGTRAGSIGIYCANEAVVDSGIDWACVDKSRVGVYIGTTEHGNVETENEVYVISQHNYDTGIWTHHHNPRTVANNPAGEITLNMKITGPHYCIGAACAAGNMGLIQGLQMLRLGEVDFALAGGVSESIHTFGIFAAFNNQGALAKGGDPLKACRPLDTARNGIVVSEGGCVYALERLESALARGAKIYGEIAGYGVNSDATDFVLPNPERQAECVRQALTKAGIEASEIDIVNLHATGTHSGDSQECVGLRLVFQDCPQTYFNTTKGFIGHAMGASGALELAGNLPAFEDGFCHACLNLDDLDPECALPNLVMGEPRRLDRVRYLLNNSFGMLGINAVLIVKRYETQYNG
ncbi:MAG: beta-ketoacyl-[acyl-carrier-protein] synthase family protein [Planctomycetia bacterium]|nr:beta-ketoacyl-[acyl-carrier-protein] synthase family protein [Planctomycetia bacterium]